MRLLEKRAVNAEVATQKKQSTEEGLRLAKKVDALRETLQTEQGNLEDFRTSSIALIQLEIDEKIREKERLTKELARLAWEKSEAMKPLDSSWITLGKQKEEIERIKDKLYMKQGELDQGINLNLQRERVNDEESKRLEGLREEAEKALDTAKAREDDATRHLMQARTQSDQLIREATAREKAVVEREKVVDLIEVSQVQRQREQDQREKEQVDKDREINDRYQTLLRTEANPH
jgi:hypothetical protein